VDSRKAAAVTIGGTLALVLALIVAYGALREQPLSRIAFLSVSWLVPVLYSQHYIVLEGTPGRAGRT
jgi:hypothetical protein